MKTARFSSHSLFLVGVLVVGFAAGWLVYTYSDPGLALDLVEEAPPAIRIGPMGSPILEGVVRSSAKGRDGSRPAGAVRYRFLDVENDEPIVGGRVYALEGVIVGTTGLEGYAEVEGVAINNAVFGADGYLAEHFFSRPDLARELAGTHAKYGFVPIQLRRDVWSATCRLKFLAADGSPAEGVEFRITCLDVPCPDGSSVPTVQSGVVTSPEDHAAWSRHALLSTMVRPDFNPDLLHFGQSSHDVTYRADGAADLRFVSAGAHRVEAKVGREFARETFDVGARPSEVTIQLRIGDPVLGRVLRLRDESPVVGANVVIRDGDAVVTSESTDVKGRFRLGPLEKATFSMAIEHPGFKPLRVDVQPGSAETVYKLDGLANHTVRGVVRRRPALTPVSDAVVRLRVGTGVDNHVAETRTDNGGRFELRSFAIEPMVEIRADGFLVYQELLNANGQDRPFDLIPEDPAKRLQDGLTGILSGTVLDAKGDPVVGRQVRTFVKVSGRPDFDRILKGGRLPMTRSTVTGPKGEFSIEWARAERVRLLWAPPPASPDGGEEFTVVLGQRQEIVLRDPR